MMQPYRILVVDNSHHVRQSSKIYLTSQGYQVFTATNPVEAQRLISEQRVHLAVVDIRLEDDEDNQDTSGLELAAGLDSIVARIIMTGYESQENMRRALRPIAPDNIPADDYILKKDGPTALLEAIERVCREEIGINWALTFEWEDVSAETVGAEIELEQTGLNREVLAGEVEELLRKLFPRADRVIVSPLLPPARVHAASQSGAAVLKVQPHYQQRGWGAPIVCKVDERHRVETEAANYERYVKDFIGGNLHTSLNRVQYTHYLGGILYSMLGATPDTARDFQDFYRQADATDISQALKYLFEDVCHYWYLNQSPERMNLTQLYREALGLTDAKLQWMLKRHFTSQQGLVIRFEGLPDAFPNPVHWIKDKELWSLTSQCVTHGDLHSHNIFVDAHHQVWLIDFGRTGEGHAWRDFIELESDVKFTLIETVDLPALYDFEIALLQPERLDDLALLQQITNPGLQKGFLVISTLRRMAAAATNDNNALPYYRGLLYQTLNVARLKKVDAKKKQHALLSAALICERLEAWGGHWNRASALQAR